MISKEEINAALGKGLTQAQLDALHNARVAVVGLGGLGSNIAVALTRLGVSNLYLYDFDKVELSNLNRQYYFLDDIGQYKADALVKHLRQINPYAALHSQVIKVTEDNIPALLGDCDIICEALDDAARQGYAREHRIEHLERQKGYRRQPALQASAKQKKSPVKKSQKIFIFAATAAAIFTIYRSAVRASHSAPCSRHCLPHALF